MAKKLTREQIDAWLEENGYIALLWAVDDVLEVRPDLTNEQAMEVLKKVERRHDCTIGVTWDTLEWTADDLFPKEAS